MLTPAYRARPTRKHPQVAHRVQWGSPLVSLLTFSLLLQTSSAALSEHTGPIQVSGSPGHTVPMQTDRQPGHTVPMQKHRALRKKETPVQNWAPAVEYLNPASQISRLCDSTGPVLLGVDAKNARTARWKGWGTSLAWFASYIGGLPSKELKVFLDLLFSKKKGLGLNIVRYNIGGGFNATLSPQFATTGSKRFRAAPSFRNDPSKGYDWSADKNQRSVLLGARARGANTFIAFANSPPWWMTISGDSAGNVGGQSNLKPQFFQAFADYLADVVERYARDPAWKVYFRYLEPFNEPEGRRRKGNNQEGCHYDTEEVSRLIPLVDEALRKRKLGTKVVAIDGVPEAVSWYAKSLPASTLKLLAHLAVHPYETTRNPTPIPRTAKQFRDVAQTARELKMDVWASEWGPNLGTGSDLGVSLYTARMIMESVNLMGANAFVYWQAIDEARDWSLINVQWGKKSAFPISFSKKYSVLKQFTRLVRPGSVNIPLDAPDGCQLNTVAFYNPCRHRLFIFAVNQEAVTRQVSLKLSGFTTAWKNVPVTSTVYRTSLSEDYQGYTGPNINLGKTVSLTAFGRSLVTLQITNVMPATGGAQCKK